MFDAYQVQRALRGHLADDDAMELLARDDATGAYWVLTRRELLVVKDQQIGERMARDQLAGSVEVSDVAVTVRIRRGESRAALLGTFRKPNRLTRALDAVLGEAPR